MNLLLQGQEKVKQTIGKFFVIILLVIGTNACQSMWQKPIPKGEIVYQGDIVNQSTHYQLGFMDSNGENNQLIMTPRQFSKPVWSSDGSFLYGLTDSTGPDYGYPAYWDLQNGKFGVCSKDLPYSIQIQGSGNPENPYEVIVQDAFTITKMDLSNCITVQVFIDNETKYGGNLIIGSSYSPIKQGIFYGFLINPTAPQYRLMYRDLKSGEETWVGEGINPTWAPDGTRIAYLGIDGLYLGYFEDNQFTSIKIVNRPFFNPLAIGGANTQTPEPAWSPDGQWLIYHRCETTKTCKWEETGIYKINVNGGNEELILKGGRFPHWKP
jgi:hypothetical protein